MKTKFPALARNYLSAFGNFLKPGAGSNLDAARDLGQQAIKLGLATLDLARIHEEALIPLLAPHSSARIRDRVIRRGVVFFTEAITPLEETHRGAREANVDMERMVATLTQRTKQLADSNRKLKDEIVQRKATEDSLRTSEQHASQLLEKSRAMQEELRLLSRRLLFVQEDERKRISRELHDVVAQNLSGINVQLAALKKQSTADVKTIYQNIASTQLLVQKSVQIVHRFAVDLRPTLLDDLGLIPAIRSYLKEFKAQSGIRVILKASLGVEKLDSTRRTVFYRIVQEALANVVKHAKASQAQISILHHNGIVCLEVKDDGNGFISKDDGIAKTAKRLGLLGMQERAEMVGGTFTVESTPRQGTVVRVEMPLPTAGKMKTNKAESIDSQST